MIHMAISELNENKGSTEEEISNFIVKEYENMPWADGDRKGRQECKRCVHYLMCALHVRLQGQGLLGNVYIFMNVAVYHSQ
ncbi:hypothetical protein S83_051071 [Arachis hypogaea]